MTLQLQVRKALRPTKLRESLQPGTILILLAGRFRGKRVVLLKHLDQGVLLVTGPFKVNGVPLRRVNARYVIATSTRVDISGVDAKTLEKVSSPDYFTKEKSKEKKSEEAFFKQGEKPQVCGYPRPARLRLGARRVGLCFGTRYTDDVYRRRLLPALAPPTRRPLTSPSWPTSRRRPSSAPTSPAPSASGTATSPTR
jgi:large subunit ribosomal protein L6e